MALEFEALTWLYHLICILVSFDIIANSICCKQSDMEKISKQSAVNASFLR
jgi:hypothetical protein